MRHRLALAALAAAAALASSEAAAASRRTAVLLIPVDRSSGSAAVRYTEYLQSAVQRRSGYVLRDAGAVLGDSTPTPALEARRRVIGALNEGKKLFSAGSYDEAESTLRTALLDVNAAAAAMERCGEYCEALEYLAGALVMKGDQPGAQDALRQLFVIEKGFRLDPEIFGKNLAALERNLEKRMVEAPMVAVTVQTTPSGGKVYLDGAYKGFAPLTIERCTGGKHLLRVERPGSITYGELVDVGYQDEFVAKARLVSTPEASALEGSLDRIVDELERGEGLSEVYRLGPKLRLDRAIVGLVRTVDSRVVLDCVFVDFASKRRLSKATRGFQGDEFGELSKEVQRFGSLLMADGEAGKSSRKKKSSDPLDNRSGYEDWDEESTGGSGGSVRQDEDAEPVKKKSKKSEDDESGTSDW